ncbi:MAG: response regulator, partial [SAR324 cluster bacterium]|nr:response regulator [SAR324 cluster bacterium]
LENIETLSSLVFGVVTDKTSRTIQDKLRIAGVEGLDMVPLGSGEMTTEMTTTVPGQLSQEQTKSPVKKTLSKDPSKSALNRDSDGPKSKVGTTSKPAETLRVDIERLDQLMNLAGQLVINKARFAQIGDRLKSSVGTKHTLHLVHNISGTLDHLAKDIESAKGNDSRQTNLEAIHTHVRRMQGDLEIVQREVNHFTQARSSISDLFEAVHQLDLVSDGIQKSVMDTRMVPIGPLFGRFKRVVRDITRGNGKEIKLVIRGEKTELDKRMIDELSDPLIHLIRNASDHAIETPDDREAAGKPRQGVITLEAFHRGNSILVRVSDDGKGLDLDAIRAKAIEKGILSKSDLEKMTPQQIYQLILEPGFTTAKVVTDVSGRGMGMDIVRSKIEELNGTVDVDSKPGEGTTFEVYLPPIEEEVAQQPEPDAAAPAGTESILYVDDEQAITVFAKRALEKLGYRVTVLTDSLEALHQFETDPTRFDLVVTDQMMPGMTGVQFASEIRRCRPEIPIILCTGFSDFAGPENADHLQINEIVYKPLGSRDLGKVVRRVLDGTPA